MAWPDIRKSVLNRIKPNSREIRVDMEFSRIIREKIADQLPSNYGIELMGSMAKGTFLKDAKDYDIFILVPKKVKKKEMEKIVLTAVKKAFPKNKTEIKYAEHPYVKLYAYGRKADIVPAYDIKYIEERETAVDRSILHTGYINRTLRKSQREDVLLLKQFLKSHNLYGAEIKYQGFSGYLCELLVIYYGSFEKIVYAAANWNQGLVIDIRKYYSEVEKTLERFKDDQLIVVDPVDKNRNVSAVISLETITKTMMVCRAFLKKPSKEFFEQRKMSSSEMNKLIKKHAEFISLKFTTPNIVDDILWGQLRKLGKHLVHYLGELDFSILDYYIHMDGRKAEILMECLENELPQKLPVLGPQVIRYKDVEKFKKSHKNSSLFLNQGRIVAIDDRRIRKIKDGIKEFLKKEKLKMPSYLKKPLSKAKLDKKPKKSVLEKYLIWRKLFRK